MEKAKQQKPKPKKQTHQVRVGVVIISGCFSSDILAAIDRAIEDNVNVLSMSLGGGMSDYYRDCRHRSIRRLAAMERGILVSCSAGNSGPTSFSLSNVALWITTVGAGTLDRDFPALAILGNGKNYSRVSLFKGDALPDKLLPFPKLLPIRSVLDDIRIWLCTGY